MNKRTAHRLRKSLPAWKRGYSTTGVIFLALVGAIFSVAYFLLPSFFSSQYEGIVVAVATTTPLVEVKEETGFVATHVPLPDAVKAIYMTQCVAGSKKLRDNLVQLIEKTELNSLVIDIKDYSGRMAFKMGTPELDESVSPVCYAPDIADFIETLHEKDIYVIGRITVFQDPYIAKLHPAWAVKKSSDKDANWADRKGIQYLDPGSPAVWDYVVDIAKRSYAIGFDELNFDYVRFPSDGNMKDIYFPKSDAQLSVDPNGGKAEVIREFFEYLSDALRPTGALL
ncbi:MAG: putative glycoside hydrolase, partial [Candidatus Taylorbacteria bacterium]|nr:putative glycoside hydrolase [Candidatus Taylorbacteria bacterium]